MSGFVRRHYPYAASAMVATALLLGDGALFILAMAAAIVPLPCACALDVDEIVERTLDPDRR